MPADTPTRPELFAVRGRLLVAGGLEPGCLIVDGPSIVEVRLGPSHGPLPSLVVDAEIVSAGLIDLQLNGAFGFEVGPDPQALQEIAARLPATGVTAFLPTLISTDLASYRAAFRAFDAALSTDGARPLGLHLEGPFLATARAGVHPRAAIEAARDDELDPLLTPDRVCLVTLAAERDGAVDRIRRLRSRGIAVSVGHSDATAAVFAAAVDAGASLVTHLFNAMSPFHHRAPAVVGAALVEDRVTAALIPDGVHCDPLALQLALRVKGPKRVALITDAVAPAGLPPGRAWLSGQPIVSDGHAARLEDGTLAGSVLTLDQAVRNMVSLARATPAEALAMATEVPARALALPDRGHLSAGARADLALWSDDLTVRATYIGGRRVFG